MKKLLSFILICFLALSANAQYPYGQKIIKNQDSDPEYSKIKRAIIQVTSKVSGTIKDERIASFVDNSISKYFPKVFTQKSGSLTIPSSVVYVYRFTQKYVLDASKPESAHNYPYTYINLNCGDNVGGHLNESWGFSALNGIPNLADNKIGSILNWCSGYEVYYSGIEKSMVDHSKFDSSSEAGINVMRKYLSDHDNTSSHCGLIQFFAWAHPLNCIVYNGTKSEGGYNYILPEFGCGGMCSITICGYDDKVEFDFGDYVGKKRGAFICIHSWGKDCLRTSKYRFYVPYYTFSTLK